MAHWSSSILFFFFLLWGRLYLLPHSPSATRVPSVTWPWGHPRAPLGFRLYLQRRRGMFSSENVLWELLSALLHYEAFFRCLHWHGRSTKMAVDAHRRCIRQAGPTETFTLVATFQRERPSWCRLTIPNALSEENHISEPCLRKHAVEEPATGKSTGQRTPLQTPGFSCAQWSRVCLTIIMTIVIIIINR